MRRNFLVLIPSFENFEALNSHLEQRCLARVATRTYALAESPPTKLLSAKERAKAEALAQVQMAAD